MPAPTIEQTPVAVRPARPISRARRGSVRPVTMRDIAGFYPLESLNRRSGRSRGCPSGGSRPVHLFHGRKRVLQAWPDRGGPGSQGQVDVGVRRRKRGGRHSGRARRRTRHGRGRARGNASRFGSGHPGVTGRNWREARGGGSESTSPLPDDRHRDRSPDRLCAARRVHLHRAIARAAVQPEQG